MTQAIGIPIFVEEFVPQAIGIPIFVEEFRAHALAYHYLRRGIRASSYKDTYFR